MFWKRIFLSLIISLVLITPTFAAVKKPVIKSLTLAQQMAVLKKENADLKLQLAKKEQERRDGNVLLLETSNKQQMEMYNEWQADLKLAVDMGNSWSAAYKKLDSEYNSLRNTTIMCVNTLEKFAHETVTPASQYPMPQIQLPKTTHCSINSQLGVGGYTSTGFLTCYQSDL